MLVTILLKASELMLVAGMLASWPALLASLMVASGANVKVIQRQLGQASASMTLDVYADLFDDDLDTVRERLDSQLFGHILDTFSGKLMQKSDK